MTKILLFVLLLSTSAYSQIKGKVVAITDGDTFVLLNEKKEQVKIRLHGIDAPEKKQDFGTAAKNYLSSLIYNKEITIEYKNLDRYGRTIGIVFIEELNVNEKMLEEGMAWHFKKYDKNSDWAALEDKAKEGKKGLWVLSNAIAPWEWRNRKKSNNLQQF
jgi:micrococcal nuclease